MSAESAIDVAPEVARFLSTAALRAVIDARRNGVVACVRCGQTLSPTDETPTTVVVRRQRGQRRAIVNLAHASCLASQILDVDTLDTRERRRATPWVALSGRRKRPPVLLWEPRTQLYSFDDGSEQGADAVELNDLGFERVFATTFADLDPRHAETLTLRVDRESAVLLAPSQPLHTFDGVGRQDPRGTWRRELLEYGACVLARGVGLQLSRPQPSVLQLAIDEGRVHAATVTVELSAV